MLLAVLNFADGAGVGALTAQDLVSVGAFDTVGLTYWTFTLEAGSGMFRTQRIATGDTLHAAVPTHDAATGDTPRIEQHAALAVAVWASLSAVGAVGLTVDNVGGVEIGPHVFATTGAGQNAIDAKTLPADATSL